MDEGPDRLKRRRIGPVRRILAGALALVLLPALPLGAWLILSEGEWGGGLFCLGLGGVMGGAMVYAAATGRSPEALKEIVYRGGLDGWGR